MEQKTTINTIAYRATMKQINAFYAIQLRVAKASIKPRVLQFAQMRKEDASEILGEMMKEYPAPLTAPKTTTPALTTQVVAPAGVN